MVTSEYLSVRANALGSTVAGFKIVSVVGRDSGGTLLCRAVKDGSETSLWLAPTYGDAGTALPFLRDARLLAELTHPSLPRVGAVGEAPKGAYVVSNELPKRNLASVMESGLSLGKAAKVLGQVAEALDTAHAADLLHRQLRPGNILVGGRLTARLVLSSFGLGLPRDAADHYVDDDQAPYAAPEELRGEIVGAPADRYSLACVLFEGLTGAPPFGVSRDDAIRGHLGESPPRLSELSTRLPALDDVFQRALGKVPADRHATAADLVSDFVRALSEQPSAPALLSYFPVVRPSRGSSGQPAPPDPAHTVEPTRPAASSDDWSGAWAPRADLRVEPEPAQPRAVSDEWGAAWVPRAEPTAEPAVPTSPRTMTGAKVEVPESPTPEPEVESKEPVRAPAEPEDEAGAEPEAEAGAEPEDEAGAEPEDEAAEPEDEAAEPEAPAAQGKPDPEPVPPVHSSPPAAATLPEARAGPPPWLTALQRAARVRVRLSISVAVIAAAAIGGLILSSLTKEDRPAPRTVTAGPLSLDIPEGWRQSRSIPRIGELELQRAVAITSSTRAGMVAGVAVGGQAKLDPARVALDVGGSLPRPSAVRLDRFEAFRWRNIRFRNAGRPVDLFVAPTSAGALTVVCYPSDATAGRPTACDRAASRVRLEGATGYSPVRGAEWRRGLDRAMRRLRERRAAGVRRLRVATDATAQAREALSLADAHRATNAELRADPVPPQATEVNRRVVGALQGLDRAYRDLGGAARTRDVSKYARAEQAIRDQDARLRRALGAI